jgi:hypothetical protein
VRFETGESAFSELRLQKVVIPESVKAIGKSAFARCCDLNRGNFALNFLLERIKEAAFRYVNVDKNCR